jgi:hypothetical protein
LSRGSFGVIGRAAAAAAHFIANIVALFWRCRLSRTDVRGVLIRIPRGEREIVVYGSYFESPWMPLGESSPLISFYLTRVQVKTNFGCLFSSLFTLIIYAAPAAGLPGVTCCCSLPTHNTYCYTADTMCNSHGSRENRKKTKSCWKWDQSLNVSFYDYYY